ncbi:hypothetical protein [Actinomadura kijaniata]|uniref:hypothetical protein n=1 Tax=Actinomadura kijaniata TaxID=46161 RepID=UPI0012FBBB24|nr:hypothetical protein [Actinomadura kijaniata]
MATDAVGEGRGDAEVRRLAAFHAALAVESALNNGWETLDRYGVDRARVEAALNELVEELHRRGRPDARPRSTRSGTPSTGPGRDVTPARDEKTRDEEARDAAGTGRPADAVPATAAAHLAPSKQEAGQGAGQVPEDGPAEAAVTWWPSTLGKVDFSQLRRPPRGLLSAWLWQWLVAAYLRGDAGMRDRHYQAWHWLETMRERRGKEPLVSHRPPGGGPEVPDRVWITEAGRAHLEEHDARYRRLWDLRVPALRAPSDAAPAAPATTTVTAGQRDEKADRDENRDRTPVPAPVPASVSAAVGVVPQGVDHVERAEGVEDAVRKVVLTQLTHAVHLVVADGRRVGWIDRPDDYLEDRPEDRAGEQAAEGWRVHDVTGRVVATTKDRDRWASVRLAVEAAAALGVVTGPDTAFGLDEPTDHRGRPLEVAPAALARWSLMRGRVPGRTDVLVRGRCVGWLQRHGTRYVACTLEGPVPGSTRRREDAVIVLLAALWAPAPLPVLPPEARTARRVQARPKNERPLCPYTPGQLAAAVADPPRREDGGYLVAVRDRWDPERRDELGVVLKTKGRRMVWTAYNTKGRPVAGGKTRTQAISQMLAVPGPLFGDPTETVLHDLPGDPAGGPDAAAHDSVTKPAPVTKPGGGAEDGQIEDEHQADDPGPCPARARHEWMQFTCTRPAGHPGPHRAATPDRHQRPVCWSDGGPVTDLQHRPLLSGALPPAPPTSRRRDPGP